MEGGEFESGLSLCGYCFRMCIVSLAEACVSIDLQDERLLFQSNLQAWHHTEW